jgi:hypothetical protein
VLDRLRDGGKLPEVRDFPEWRRERQAWFLAREPREEPWHLHDGTHLRVVGQPMPDGGLLLIFEDRPSSCSFRPRATPAAHAHRHVRQPVRALAVFGPDSRLQLWNRRFAPIGAGRGVPRYPSARRHAAHRWPACSSARRKWA